MKTRSEVQDYYPGRGKTMTLEGERMLRVGELVLRLAVVLLGSTAAALVGTDSQVKMIFGTEKKAKFSDMKVIVFLVAVNGVVAGYSLLQGLCCLVRAVKGIVVFHRGLALLVFVCDQVMAYVTLSAAAAAAESGVLGLFGQPEFQWLKVCNVYKIFCIRLGAGLVIAFLTSLVMISLSSISAFSLFRLFGRNEGGKCSNRAVITISGPGIAIDE